MKTFTHAPIKIEEISATTGADGNRVYQTPDGKLYPSVTTVLAEHSKKGIMEWRQRVGEVEANKQGPEVNLSKTLIEHASCHLWPPEIEACKH